MSLKFKFGGMSKKSLFLMCVWWCCQRTDLIAFNITKPKLTPAEWWTAPYMTVFGDADIKYAFNPKDAYEILDTIISRATKENLPKWVAQAYHAKGLYLERQLAFQAALDNYLLTAKSAENVDRQRFASVQIDIAITYRNLYRYPEARNVYLSLIEHCLKNKDSLNLLNATGGLGILFFTVNDYENAIRYYQKALNASREQHNYINECIYLDNLSEAYGAKKQFKQAFEYIELACQIADREKDIESKIPLYERYAHLYADFGALDKAFDKINAGLELCQTGNFIRDRNNLTIVKAELYLKQQNIDFALATFKTINEKLINVNSLTKVYYELGKIYEQKKELALAENYFTKSYQLADKNQSLRYMEWNHRALYRIYRLKNQSKEALAHLECANTLRDSLFNYEKSGQVTELQFRYDLAQSEQQLQEVQMKANRNKMWVGALICLLIITFLVFGYYWQRKQNEMLTLKNEAIRLQKEQLEAFNQEILMKNQAIEAQKQLLETSNVMLQQSKAQLETFNQAILTKNQAIEAQKQLLETSNTMLQQSNGMLQQFNYAVAHDLREPLRNISSFVTLIQRRYMKDLPPTAASYFEFVTTGATRMSKMLEGLLKYSMLSMNTVTDLEILNVRDVVNEVKDSLRLISEEKKACIIFPDIMPQLYINKIHLTQLFQNLVSNALKFATRAPIIEIGSQEVDEQLLLFIKDNGIGIHPESGKKLFNLFHRLHRDSSQFEGTGVGLALCKNIVEKYGGKIWFESVENEGTTFWMQFHKRMV
jgi:signal transduction histidine kinase